jgi:hypothetical protein
MNLAAGELAARGPSTGPSSDITQITRFESGKSLLVQLEQFHTLLRVDLILRLFFLHGTLLEIGLLRTEAAAVSAKAARGPDQRVA